MTRPSPRFQRNYQTCLSYLQRLIEQDLTARGADAERHRAAVRELSQSVIGDARVAALLDDPQFTPAANASLLTEVLADVRRQLFPLVRQKRFLSLQKLPPSLLASEPEADLTWNDRPPAPDESLPESLKKMLPPECYDYLTNVLLVQFPAWSGRVQRLTAAPTAAARSRAARQLAQRIGLFRRFYPDGRLPHTPLPDGRKPLSQDEVIDCYRRVYLGIEKSFPPQFLSREALFRCRVLVRFLVEEILQTRPEEVLSSSDQRFFHRHKLQNVYRHFNYSCNRVLANAYPKVIHPWQNSRSEARHWEDPRTRVAAIRWLVEECLGYRPAPTGRSGPAQLFRHRITRSVFAAHGLSYMFNCYYKSVSRALAAAYPQLNPWELGPVPLSFWNASNAAAAVRWMVAAKGWLPEELPARYRSGEFNRKTFSEMGLATLFEKKFSRNLFRAVSAAWPDKFQPWELGRVSREYWSAPQNVFHATRWLAEAEGLEGPEVLAAIRERRLTMKEVRKYPIGAALSKWCGGKLQALFAPFFWQERRELLQEHRLLRKIDQLKRFQQPRGLLYLLLYGFFWQDSRLAAQQNARHYDRIARRIQRRGL